VAGCCDNGNENSGFLRSGEILDYLEKCLPFQQDKALWSWCVYLFHVILIDSCGYFPNEFFFVVDTRRVMNETENYFLMLYIYIYIYIHINYTLQGKIIPVRNFNNHVRGTRWRS